LTPGFAKLRPRFVPQNRSASAAMTFLFHDRSKKVGAGRWWLGLFMASALAFPGCKQLGLHDESPHNDALRRNDLALPARQVRIKERLDNRKKSADDAWMSDEAQGVYHDLD
jgi:hypothetical protein